MAGTSVNTTLKTGQVDHVVVGAVEELKGNEAKSMTEEELQPSIPALNTGQDTTKGDGSILMEGDGLARTSVNTGIML